MPNGINNWKYKEVKKVLLENGFSLSRAKGSHHQYAGFYNKRLRVVTVPYHGSKSITPRTMKSIMTQSGISKQEWMQ